MITNILYNTDCLTKLKTLPDNSVDCLVTDPPAGIAFMSRGWDSDKGGRDKWIAWLCEIMMEVLRVLKPGSHGFVWALPRTSHWTAMALEDAGFEIRDCIYHTFASGFPKSHAVGKAIDKRNGNEREVITEQPQLGAKFKIIQQDIDNGGFNDPNRKSFTVTKGNGKYEGQGTALKPAVECWWLIRKPLSEKSIAENVLKWGTGGLNIDQCRIPYVTNDEPAGGYGRMEIGMGHPQETMPMKPKPFGKPTTGFANNNFGGISNEYEANNKGRFPANLLVSDDVLNDGKEHKGLLGGSNGAIGINKSWTNENSDFSHLPTRKQVHDKGSYSRYFDLDKWFSTTFPFIITPKASKREKNNGCDNLEEKDVGHSRYDTCAICGGYLMLRGKRPSGCKCKEENAVRQYNTLKNNHPTVKPIKLMAYLITLGSRSGDIILDPFAGSGSTLVAAKMLNRQYIGMEMDKSYCEIAEARLSASAPNKPTAIIADKKAVVKPPEVKNELADKFFGAL